MTRETIAKLELSPFEMTSWQNGWAGYPKNLYVRAADQVGGMLGGGGFGQVITKPDGTKWRNLEISKTGSSSVKVSGDRVSMETVPDTTAEDTFSPDPEPAPEPSTSPTESDSSSSDDSSSSSESSGGMTPPTDSSTESDSTEPASGSAPVMDSPTDSPASPSSGLDGQPTSGSESSTTDESDSSGPSKRTLIFVAGAGAVLYGVTR